jgi:hypothetical protein
MARAQQDAAARDRLRTVQAAWHPGEQRLGLVPGREHQTGADELRPPGREHRGRAGEDGRDAGAASRPQRPGEELQALTGADGEVELLRDGLRVVDDQEMRAGRQGM